MMATFRRGARWRFDPVQNDMGQHQNCHYGSRERHRFGKHGRARIPKKVGGGVANFNWSGQGGQPTWFGAAAAQMVTLAIILFGTPQTLA
ncbi:hypothetical protein HGG76_00015 [Ochrobactrum tritici]|uniref:Uncharacterized protein n=1 Tax=Brucella tritici TaxID=94626 RepID=A0A7X6FQ00_9HYPH|nr:hypothetical protein [Brucella tritici]